MKTTLRTLGRTLTILTLAAALAAPALAQDNGCGHLRDRRGWLVGFDAGFGSSSYGAKEGTRSYTDEAYSGGFGSLRAGYAFNNKLAVSLEGHGFGSEEGDQDWGMGAGVATLTWFPGGGGFFVRGGVGVGGGEVLLRETGEKVQFDGKAAGLFGIGYEWQLGRKFALGVAADGLGFHLDGVTGADEDWVGIGGVTVQLNWYL